MPCTLTMGYPFFFAAPKRLFVACDDAINVHMNQLRKLPSSVESKMTRPQCYGDTHQKKITTCSNRDQKNKIKNGDPKKKHDAYHLFLFDTYPPNCHPPQKIAGLMIRDY